MCWMVVYKEIIPNLRPWSKITTAIPSNGFSEKCNVSKPVIEKTFRLLKTSSEEKMPNICADCLFDYQFLEENDNLEESKLLNDNENWL
jgi:hypothetical protein